MVSCAPERAEPKERLDGVQLAILNKRFEAVCRKMANTLLRTGRSGVLNIARDFSCCIVSAGDELLATAESLPIHVLIETQGALRDVWQIAALP